MATPNHPVSKSAQRRRDLELGINRTQAQMASEFGQPVADPELTPAEEPETAPGIVAPDLDDPVEDAPAAEE